ncbi:hypothetical protein GRAN_3867 [Granulicella sibirica]|uniref:Uncharacterized protein n=1 Tax=Granulicella sibirica TaxID=2479048 RepID=A0A4Q0SUN7_9BACT|nr:hypothetical protein GRAN_3867 [Granulicella sibirica]
MNPFAIVSRILGSILSLSFVLFPGAVPRITPKLYGSRSKKIV